MALKEIRSKYQEKNYEEIEYHLEEMECPKCSKPFMIDSRYSLTEYSLAHDEDMIVYYCPYCGAKWRAVL